MMAVEVADVELGAEVNYGNGTMTINDLIVRIATVTTTRRVKASATAPAIRSSLILASQG